jgi:hypothetical protein
MIKRRIESGLGWMEVNISGTRISCVYGFCDGTSVHGHTVFSGSEITYQRNISGANLISSGANLIFSGANLTLLSLYKK